MSEQITQAELMSLAIQYNIAIAAEKDAKDVLDDFRDELPQLLELEDAVKTARNRKNDLEKDLRDKSIQYYGQTGDTSPISAVKIAMWTGILYDEDDAIAWAKENAPIMVLEVLDKKQFETYVKSTKNPPDFVVIEDDPKATIIKKELASLGVEKSDVPF